MDTKRALLGDAGGAGGALGPDRSGQGVAVAAHRVRHWPRLACALRRRHPAPGADDRPGDLQLDPGATGARTRADRRGRPRTTARFSLALRRQRLPSSRRRSPPVPGHRGSHCQQRRGAAEQPPLDQRADGRYQGRGGLARAQVSEWTEWLAVVRVERLAARRHWRRQPVA